MAKVFLSYSRKDAAKAQRFTEWLERTGHDVWRDEDDIGGGASFSSEIENALKDCDCVLVLWSADSVQSAWVRDEAGFGRDLKKLIPLSLDRTEPPLGFRQFQSIDVSRWKGRVEPLAAQRIAGAIARIEGGRPPSISQVTTAVRPRGMRPRREAVIVIALLLLVTAAVVGIFLWKRSPAGDTAIAVLPSPTSPDRTAAADYANVAAADMAAFLPKHFDHVILVAPGDASDRTSEYKFLISANRHGNGADAAVTLSNSDGRSIIWSKSWNVLDSSAVDLSQMVSRTASQAAFCLMKARGGPKRIDQPALGAFLGGCSNVGGSDASDDELRASFERVVELAPDFPEGWAYLSVILAVSAVSQKNGPQPAYDDTLQKARVAIATARKLNPRSGLSYLAESLIPPRNTVRSVSLLDKAAKLEPDNGFIAMLRSGTLMSVGRTSDSVAAANRAIELDPLSTHARQNNILILAYAGEFSQAQADLADARKKWPNDGEIDLADFGVNLRYGDPRRAEQLMARVLNLSDAQLVPYRKIVEARLDPTSAKIEDAIKEQPDHNKELLALGLFGKVNETYQLLNDLAFQPSLDPSALFRPEFAPVRADPRFMEVAARLGLVRYWQESGDWPDFCAGERLKYDCKTEATKYRN